jgi:hypothetical protein
LQRRKPRLIGCSYHAAQQKVHQSASVQLAHDWMTQAAACCCLLLCFCALQRFKPDMIAFSELRDKHAPQQELHGQARLTICAAYVILCLHAACPAAVEQAWYACCSQLWKTAEPLSCLAMLLPASVLCSAASLT